MDRTSYAPGTPNWVDLGSPDPAASAEFYAGLFGWEVEVSGPETGNYRMCLVKGRPVAGIGVAEQPGPPYWTTYIDVDDADAAAAAVTAAGGTVVVPPFEVADFGRMAVFADPTGAAFSVWQPRSHIGAYAVNEPGALCWNELTTREPARARDFYPAVFGWTARESAMGEVTYVEWLLGEDSIAGMMPMDETWPAGIPSHWMVYFAVEDTDAAAARAQELGGTVSVPPTDIPIGRFSVLNDPHGAVFSVIALPAG